MPPTDPHQRQSVLACASYSLSLSQGLTLDYSTERPLTRPNAGQPIPRGKESVAPASSSNSSSSPQPITPSERQLLSLLSSLSSPTLSSPTFTTTLQSVKSSLFNKDYQQAFAEQGRREAYAARWVPSRALIYRRIFREMGGGRVLRKALFGGQGKGKGKAIMLGGGAGSEVLALGSWLGEEEEEDLEGAVQVEILAVDSSDWSSILLSQKNALLASYPSLNKFTVNFLQSDILSPSSSIPYSTAGLITLLFTISELFLQSRASTLSLLSSLTSQTQRGTLLLIIESASLSLIPIGNAGNLYPLGLLLDKALSEDKGRGEGERARWEVVEEEESKWYRMPQGSEGCYPLGLENSRWVSLSGPSCGLVSTADHLFLLSIFSPSTLSSLTLPHRVVLRLYRRL